MAVVEVAASSEDHSPVAAAVELLSPVADDGAEILSPPVAVVDAALRRPPAAVDGRAWEHEVDQQWEPEVDSQCEVAEPSLPV